MKTKLIHDKGVIRLVIDEPGKKRKELNALAALYSYADCGCWQLYDIRLRKFMMLSPYAVSPSASEVCASFKPENESDAEFVKSQLREYEIEEDGTIRWCSFEGVVPGAPSVNGYRPVGFDKAGYFSRSEGLARLKEMQQFWDGFEGDIKAAKLDNPLRQMTGDEMFSAVVYRNFMAKREAAADEDGGEIAAPAPGQ